MNRARYGHWLEDAMRRAGVALDVPRRHVQGERRANMAQQNLALARLEAECCKARSGIRVRLLRKKNEKPLDK